MALNIAVTSKFDPFTQEDYIKPLANYWKEYEKYEDALFAENAKLAALDPYLGYFLEDNAGDAALLKQYNQYKQALESARDQMSQGLNAQTRRQIRGDILPMYGSHIVPIQEAFQKKAAAITDYQKQAAHNPLLMSSRVNPLNMSVSDFYGINNGAAGYFTEDGNKVVNDIKNAIGNFTGSHIVEQTRDAGDKRITEKVTGYPRISMSIIDGQITFGEGTDKELEDKITKMYNDAKDQYKYIELDDTSRNIFDRSFASGIDQGWIYSKHTGSAPKPKILTPTHTIEKVRDNNGNLVDANIWTNENGDKIYSIGGKNYHQKDINDWAAKYQKKQDELKANAEFAETIQRDTATRYRENRSGEDLSYIYNDSAQGNYQMKQRDYWKNKHIGGDGRVGEGLKAYKEDHNVGGTDNQVIDHMIYNMVIRHLGNSNTLDPTKLLVGKENNQISLATAWQYSKMSDSKRDNITDPETGGENYVYLRYDGDGGDYHMIAVPLRHFMNNLAHRYLSDQGLSAKQIAATIRAIEMQKGYPVGSLAQDLIDMAATYVQGAVGEKKQDQINAYNHMQKLRQSYDELFVKEESSPTPTSKSGVTTGVPMEVLQN